MNRQDFQLALYGLYRTPEGRKYKGWQYHPSPPPLPRFPESPFAIEFYLSDLIKAVRLTEHELGKRQGFHCTWKILRGQLKARFKATPKKLKIRIDTWQGPL